MEFEFLILSFLQGGRLASCSEDTSVKIWTRHGPGNKEGVVGDAWKVGYTIAGVHARAVYSIDWSREGVIVTGGGEDAIRLFREDPGVGEWVCELTQHDSHDMDINCVTFNPTDSSIIASCSDDETVKIWTLEM